MTDRNPQTPPPDEPRRNPLTGPVLKGLLMLATLAAVGLAVRALDLGHALDEHWVDTVVRGQGASGWLLLAGAGALFIALGLPRQVVAFLAGYAYGFLAGTAICTLAVTAGCGLTFWYARFFGRDFVARRFGNKVRKVDDFLRRNPFSTTFIIRLMPLGSNLATNLAAGVTAVGATPFLAATALGSIPQTMVFALLGSGFQVETGWRVGLSVALFAASTLLGMHLYRRNKAAAAISEDD